MSVTAHYYHRLAYRLGFADGELRGGYTIVVAPPIAPTGLMHREAYCAPAKDGKPRLTRRDRALDADATERARQAVVRGMTVRLRQVVGAVADRRSSLGPHVLEVLEDAEALLRGCDYVAKGPRLEVIKTMVRVLSRHA